MARYAIFYLGFPESKGQEADQAQFQKFQTWLSSLGDAVISAGNPVMSSNVVNQDGSISKESKINISGFSIIEAETEAQALAMAQACPYLESGCALEVSQLMQM